MILIIKINFIQKKPMGAKLCSLFKSKKHSRILMFGLDGAGKTSILYQFKLSDLVKTTQTIGFNLETIKYKELFLTIWDIGGHNIFYDNECRILCKHYFQNTDGIIFVIDCNDKERFGKANKALLEIINNEELKNIPLLIFGNKQDLKEAISPDELIKFLEMKKIKNNKWLLQGSSALNGRGIKEGFDWLSNILLERLSKGIIIK